MWTLLALACSKQPAPTNPEPSDDGPIAGPHAVLEEAPPAPLPADTPGGGPLPPYLTAVRKALAPDVAGCGKEAEHAQPALVTVTLDAEGGLRDLELKRSSGDPDYDQCLQKAFRTSKLPAPPAEVLDADSRLVTDFAFR